MAQQAWSILSMFQCYWPSETSTWEDTGSIQRWSTEILALLGTALFLRFWEQNKKETKDSPPGPPPGKEWCGHHLLKSRIQRLRVDRLRDAACPGTSRAWQGRRQAAPLYSESELLVEVSVPRSWRKQLQRVLSNPETRHWTCQVKAEIKAVPVSNSTVRSICKPQDCSLRSASADAGSEPWETRTWAPSLWKNTRRVRSVCKGSTSQCSQQALPSADRACSFSQTGNTKNNSIPTC